ncbi:MAG: NAD(P)-dependent oxidoreductase [Bacteriovoracaceae bacterium]|nr:NAD(P)-dependent oxidoreductase [Bacteriovoracaceae bacterium]
MHVLLSGASGFVGKNLAHKLIENNFKLTLITRKSSQIDRFLKDRCTILTYEKDTPEEILKRLKTDDPPSIIIHLAAQFKSDHNLKEITNLIQSNIILGAQLAEIGKILGVKKFINTTTYSTSISGEDFDPQNFYAVTKKSFEDILFFYSLEKNFQVFNLTLYDTYGPGDNRLKFINLILDAAKNKEILNMSPGEQEISYIYIDDVIQGILDTIRLETNSFWNNFSLHSNEHYTLNKLVKIVEKSIGTTIATNPGYYSYRAREIMKFKPRHSLIPGFEAKTTIAEGIKQIIEKGCNYEQS